MVFNLFRPARPLSVLVAFVVALLLAVLFFSNNSALAQSAPTISQLVAAENRGQAPEIGKTQTVTKQLAAPSRDFRQARQVRVPIDWAAAQKATAAYQRAGRMPKAALAQTSMNEIAMPIIIPEKMPTNGQVFGKDYYYHAISRHDGYSVSVHGTCVLSEIRSSGDQKAASEGMQIFQTEDGMAASFSLFGAAYSVMMVCDNPAGDSRCKSPAFMKKLVDGMVVQIGAGK